ncbi:MAG TPA: hypothetical protein VFV10_04590, partial [Gammaproteobacteria bacterium]|nr:hypothetical protein [Gammaproteobacteria bacterium]
MSWERIAESRRCEARPGQEPGGEKKKRCKAPILLGAWFWLEGKKCFCVGGALDAGLFPDDDLGRRGRELVH